MNQQCMRIRVSAAFPRYRHLRLVVVCLSVILSGGGAAAVAQSDSTFYVSGRYLYDPCGSKVILRGANAMIVYWDRLGENSYPELAKTGANCCRIFWNTDYPTPTANELDQTLTNCWANKMIPMPSVWMATGDWSKLDICVDYWLGTDVLPVLKKHQKHLLLNIANEPGAEARSDFGTKYASIVTRIRNAGLHCPLVIDADKWGRRYQSLIKYGPSLVQGDPDHNLIFSWHDWDPSTWGNGSRDSVKSGMDQSITANICYIVGEFGPCEQCGNCTGTKIEWEYIIQYAHQHEIGFLPWVWRWDDCHGVVTTSNDSYGAWANAPWGEGVMVSNTYSVQKTAQRTPYIDNGRCASTVAHPGRLSSLPRGLSAGGYRTYSISGAAMPVLWHDGAGAGASGVRVIRGSVGALRTRVVLPCL